MKINTKLISLILLYIIARLNSYRKSSFIEKDDEEESVIYSDEVISNPSLKHAKSPDDNDSYSDEAEEFNHSKSTIKNLKKYLADNEKSGYFNQSKIKSTFPYGDCFASHILNYSQMTFSDLVNKKRYYPVSNLKKLEIAIDSRNKNLIYNDDKGNFLVVSISTDSRLLSKFIFVSKLDFSFFIFQPYGDEIPSLKESMVDHLYIPSMKKHVVALYGGISSIGTHSNDIFIVEIEYGQTRAYITKYDAKNTTPDEKDIPIGLSEGSLSIIPFKTANSTVDKFAVILYGGLTDVLMSNSIYIFEIKKGWLKYRDLNLPKLKGMSSLVIKNDNPYELYGTISQAVLKYSIYIFGGRNTKSYNNNLFKLEVTYVIFDDSFFIQPFNILIYNKEIVTGRENHVLLQDINAYKQRRENIIFLVGGKNFFQNKTFDNEIFRLNLKGSLVNGKVRHQWEKMKVKSGNLPTFSNSNASFFYDQVITSDSSSIIKFVYFNSSCDKYSCLKIDLKTQIIKEKNYEGSSSVTMIKTYICQENNKKKKKIDKLNNTSTDTDTNKYIINDDNKIENFKQQDSLNKDSNIRHEVNKFRFAQSNKNFNNFNTKNKHSMKSKNKVSLLFSNTLKLKKLFSKKITRLMLSDNYGFSNIVNIRSTNNFCLKIPIRKFIKK
jgi:hypothetical protein